MNLRTQIAEPLVSTNRLHWRLSKIILLGHELRDDHEDSQALRDDLVVDLERGYFGLGINLQIFSRVAAVLDDLISGEHRFVVVQASFSEEDVGRH